MRDSKEYRLLIGPSHPLLKNESPEKMTVGLKSFQVMPLSLWIQNPIAEDSQERIQVCLSMDVKQDEALLEPSRKIPANEMDVTEETLQDWAARLNGTVKTTVRLSFFLKAMSRSNILSLSRTV